MNWNTNMARKSVLLLLAFGSNQYSNFFGLCLVGLITGSPDLRQTNIAQEVIVSLLDLLISFFTDIVWNPGQQLMSIVEGEEESNLKTGSRLTGWPILHSRKKRQTGWQEWQDSDHNCCCCCGHWRCIQHWPVQMVAWPPISGHLILFTSSLTRVASEDLSSWATLRTSSFSNFPHTLLDLVGLVLLTDWQSLHCRWV